MHTWMAVLAYGNLHTRQEEPSTYFQVHRVVVLEVEPEDSSHTVPGRSPIGRKEVIGVVAYAAVAGLAPIASPAFLL
jgi:hypothetical protein